MLADRAAEDLISACLAKRCLTGQAAKKAAWLVQCGLDPEQALVGTGLLSPEKYLELSGQQEMRSQERRRLPSDQPDLSLRSLAKLLLEAMDESKAESLTLRETKRTVAAFLDTDPYEAFFEFPAAFLSPLILRLQRVMLKDGWRLTREPLADGELVTLTRGNVTDETAQPLQWMWQLKSYAQAPEGLLAIIGADERILDKISDWHFPVMTAAPSDVNAEEQVQHEALMGTPVIVHLVEDRPWLDELAQAGVPVRVVKCRPTSDGCQYEAYRF